MSLKSIAPFPTLARLLGANLHATTLPSRPRESCLLSRGVSFLVGLAMGAAAIGAIISARSQSGGRQTKIITRMAAIP